MLFRSCLWITVLCLLQEVRSQSPCTLPSEFQNSVWVDSDKGDLTFDTVNMTGWGFKNPAATQNIVDEWECFYTGTVDSKVYLILKCKQNINFNGVFTPYLCMELTQVSSYSYYYYLVWAEQPNYENERITTFDAALSISDAVQDLCLDTTNPTHAAVYPETSEYHILVKQGNEADAKQECPSTFFGEYYYNVTDLDSGTTDCGSGDEVWDVCTDYSHMTFNYTICNTQISYSANGSVFCLVSITSGSFVYHTVYNEDNAVDASSSTYRFTCFMIELSDGHTLHVQRCLINVREVGPTIDIRFYIEENECRAAAKIASSTIEIRVYGQMSEIASDGILTVSQTPGSCKKGQTPNTQPVSAFDNSPTGLNMQLTSRVLCPKTSTTVAQPTTDAKSGGLSTGAIVGMVLGALIAIAAIILIVLCCMKINCRHPNKNKREKDETPATSPRAKKLSADIDDLPHQRSPPWIHGPHGTPPGATTFSGDHKISKSPTLDHKYNPFSVPPFANGKLSRSDEIPNGVPRTPESKQQSSQKSKTDIPVRKETKSVSKSIQTENLYVEDLEKVGSHSENNLSSNNVYHKPNEHKSPAPFSGKDSIPVQTASDRSQSTNDGADSRSSNITPKGVVLETRYSKSDSPNFQKMTTHSSDMTRATEEQHPKINKLKDRGEISSANKICIRDSGKPPSQTAVFMNPTTERSKTPITDMSHTGIIDIPKQMKRTSLKTVPPTDSSLPNNPEIIKKHFKREDLKYAAAFFQAPKTPVPGPDNEKNFKGRKKNKVVTKAQSSVSVKENTKKSKRSTNSNTKRKSNKKGQQAFSSLVRSKSTGVNRNKKGTFYNEDIPTNVETESYLNISESRSPDKGICYDDDNERARALGFWSHNDTDETDVSHIRNLADNNPKELKLALGTLDDRSVSRMTLSTDISLRGSVSTMSLSAITGRIDSRGAKYFIENESSSIAIHVKASDVPDDLEDNESLQGDEENEDHDQEEEGEDEYEDEDEEGEDFDETKEIKDNDNVKTSMSVLYGQVHEGDEDMEDDPDRMVIRGYEPGLLPIKE